MDFIEVARASGVIDDAPTFAEIGMKILNFLLAVAGVLAIISFVVAGFLYFAAGGEEKKMQTAKKAFSYAVIGTVAIFSALVGVKAVISFL